MSYAGTRAAFVPGMVSQLATTTDHLLGYGRCSKRRGPHVATPHYRHTSSVHEELTAHVAPLAFRSARRSLAARLVVVLALAVAGGAVFGIHARHVAPVSLGAH